MVNLFGKEMSSFQVDDETKKSQIAHFELSPEEGVASEAEGSTPGAPPRF